MKDVTTNDSNYGVGETVWVFDPELWRKNGGDSKTDTFMRQAVILNIRREKFGRSSPLDLRPKCGPRLMADVRFLHNNKESRGHFLWAISRTAGTEKLNT